MSAEFVLLVIATAFKHWKAMQNASYAEQPSQSAERAGG